jgi:GT2 family glycosyltransferase
MDIKETPVISFITICYNGLADTCALIDSLQAAVHSVSYEIIVVDNASRQNEAAVISRRYPFVKTIRSKRNLGFSGGNNLGIREAGGKYIFLINNDTYITDDGLPEIGDRPEDSELLRLPTSSPDSSFASMLRYNFAEWSGSCARRS